MSDVTRLNELRIARDTIEAALASGKDFIKVEVRGRLVEVVPSITRLNYFNDQIEKLERKANTARGPARNRVRLRRA